MDVVGIERIYLRSFGVCRQIFRRSMDLAIRALLYPGTVEGLWHGDRKNHDLTGGYDLARGDFMRVCTQPDNQTVTEIERITSERGISKSQFLLEALNHFMSCNGQKPDASTGADLKTGYDQAVSLAEQRQREIDGLKAEIDRLKASLEGAQSKFEKETLEKNQAQQEAAKANEDVQGLRTDLEHSHGVVKLKDDEIGFLRATIHQLSDKIPRALPMSEEEARAKRWWKFW